MVARDRIGCIMPKNMCLRKDLTEEIIANHFMMTHVFIMQPSTESFSFAVFLRYANALHSRDEPQCRVGLGKKNIPVKPS